MQSTQSECSHSHSHSHRLGRSNGRSLPRGPRHGHNRWHNHGQNHEHMHRHSRSTGRYRVPSHSPGPDRSRPLRGGATHPVDGTQGGCGRVQRQVQRWSLRMPSCKGPWVGSCVAPRLGTLVGVVVALVV